jgi:MFS family permease
MELDRRIAVVVGGNFVAVAARMSLVTFLGIYFVREVGIPIAFVGLAFLVENLMRGFLSPLFGALSDRIGRRAPLLAGLAGNALVLPCFLLVEGPVSLIAWSLALGLAAAVQMPASAALLVDLAPLARRQTVLAINYTAISAGYTLGVAPGGFIAEQGYGLLAATSSAGYAAVALFFARALRGPLPSERAQAGRSLLRQTFGAAQDRVFLGFAALAFVFPFTMGLLAFVCALYAADSGVGEGTIGLILAANGVITAVLAVPVASRIEERGPFHLLGPAAAIVAMSFACLALVPGVVWGLLAGMLIITAAELVFSSAVPTAVARLAPGGERGAYQGAWTLVQSLGMGSAFLASGLLRDLVGWRVAWLAFAALAAAAALGLLATRRRFLHVSDTRSGAH